MERLNEHKKELRKDLVNILALKDTDRLSVKANQILYKIDLLLEKEKSIEILNCMYYYLRKDLVNTLNK